MTDKVEIFDPLLTHFEFVKRVSARLGYTPDGLHDRVKKEYSNGVPASLVDVTALEYEAGSNTAALFG
jgi:hypothetical protein